MRGVALAVFYAVAGLSLTAAARGRAADPVSPEKRVSIRLIRKPMFAALEELSRAADLRLEAEAELREQKVVLLVRERPAREVMDRIAETFGAQWVKQPAGRQGEERYRLER